MKRFTERDKYNDANIIGIDSARLYKELDYDEDLILTFALNKFAYLEDIEEEIGIRLIAVFKALKTGFYYKNFAADRIDFSKDYNSSVVIDTDGILLGNKGKMLFKDYGNTWALTRQELEENNEQINK